MLAQWIPKGMCNVPGQKFSRQNSECAYANAALLFLVTSEPLEEKEKSKGTDLKQSV